MGERANLPKQALRCARLQTVRRLRSPQIGAVVLSRERLKSMDGLDGHNLITIFWIAEALLLAGITAVLVILFK
jgi:hypothetical protein